jgi:hypothetical protein
LAGRRSPQRGPAAQTLFRQTLLIEEIRHALEPARADGDDLDADVTGLYWYHQQPQPAAPAARDKAFQVALLARLALDTGVSLT